MTTGRRLAAALCLAAAGCAADTPPLLVLVTVDTLRADHLGAYGSGRGLTPNLDALAAGSAVFTAAYAPASFTLPSVAALLTGRHPEALGIWKNESAVPEGVPTLASALRDRGWRTAAVVSNFVLRRRAGLDAGFDRYDDALPQRERVRRWPERAAAATTDAALSLLEGCRAGARCFLWVHYQDPHGPYTPPAPLRARQLPVERAAPGGARRLPLLPDHSGLGGIPRYQAIAGRRDVAFYRAGYAGEVERVDAEIGRLLAAIGPAAAVAFAADHGESLGEDDYWFAHGELLSEPLVRVPLLVQRPGAAPARRDDVASLLDLFPTLLVLATREPAPPDTPGRDLFAAGAADGASVPYLVTLGASQVPRYGIVEGDWKLVVSERDGETESVLVRRDGGGRATGAPAAALETRLRARLARIRAALPRSAPAEPAALSEAEREALDALGYSDAPSSE